MADPTQRDSCRAMEVKVSQASVRVILLTWFGSLLFSLSKSSWIGDAIFGALSVAFGTTFLVAGSVAPDARKRYRSIGLIFLIFGVLLASLNLLRRFF